MTYILQSMLGFGLMIVGAIKTLSHASTASQIKLPGCLGGEFTLSVGSPHLSDLHCWGCYAALAGLGLTLYAVWRMYQARQGGQLLLLP